MVDAFDDGVLLDLSLPARFGLHEVEHNMHNLGQTKLLIIVVEYFLLSVYQLHQHFKCSVLQQGASRKTVTTDHQQQS